MKVGIPNILPITTVSIMSVFLGGAIYSFQPLDVDNPGPFIGISIFALICLATLIIMLYQFKVILMKSDEIVIIQPLKFSINYIPYEDIVNVEWKLIESVKIGSFRQLSISRETPQLKFSDLEFANFNDMQDHIIKHISFEPDFEQKEDVEIDQAKINVWVNALIILLMGLFMVLMFVSIDFENPRPIKFIVLAIITLLIGRLLLRFLQYLRHLL